MYCSQCGAGQKDSARYCTNCGKLLRKTTEPMNTSQKRSIKGVRIIALISIFAVVASFAIVIIVNVGRFAKKEQDLTDAEIGYLSTLKEEVVAFEDDVESLTGLFTRMPNEKEAMASLEDIADLKDRLNSIILNIHSVNEIADGAVFYVSAESVENTYGQVIEYLEEWQQDYIPSVQNETTSEKEDSGFSSIVSETGQYYYQVEMNKFHRRHMAQYVEQMNGTLSSDQLAAVLETYI